MVATEPKKKKNSTETKSHREGDRKMQGKMEYVCVIACAKAITYLTPYNMKDNMQSLVFSNGTPHTV